MKFYRDGKCYNTKTAEEVAYHSHGYQNDFHYYEETLYRTEKDAWFLVGEGGPMSKYAKSVGQNSWGSGSGEIILSKQEALEWLEAYDENDAIEEYFSEDIEEA